MCRLLAGWKPDCLPVGSRTAAIRQAVGADTCPNRPVVGKAITLGAALREARRDAGLSARDLERLTGISTAQISKVESGARTDPSFRTVMRLARGIGISLDDLVARTEGQSVQQPAAKPAALARLLADLRKAKSGQEHADELLEKTIEAVTGMAGSIAAERQK